MTHGECLHGGDPATCPPCNQPTGRANRWYRGHARFPSDCPTCGLPIRVGDAIARHVDGDLWCHDGCVDPWEFLA